MDGVTTGRPIPTRAPGSTSTRRGAGALPSLLAIAALIAACAAPAPTVPPSPGTTPFPSSAADESGAPTAHATPNPSPTATPDPAAWTRLTLADAPAVATLVPTKAGRGGVAVDTAFKLTTLDGRAPADVAARLVSEPPLTFKVASTAGATAVIRPTAKLRAGTLYRISLTRADGSVETAWAAQTALPLAVIETIPGNQATGVPLTAGIEIIFNQSGVTTSDLKKHVTIKPTTAGRFQAAGRTLVFVPSKPLAKGRVYTVTVKRGLPLAGTGQVLADDVVVQFETAAKARSAVRVDVQRSFQEASPREKAAISVYIDEWEGIDEPEGAKAPTAIPVTVHRLAGLAAAMDAWKAIEKAPDWTRVSTTAPVPTAGLPRVVKASLKVQVTDESSNWIQLPKRLAAGWYLVTETWAGVPRQAVLQVTDIATFSMLGMGQSAVWVNDLATKKAAAGATVAIDARPLGVTDSRGLLVASTPSALELGEEASSSPILVVSYGSQSAFQPLSMSFYCAGCAPPTTDDQWWQLFSSDRNEFRSTDTINAWGVVRNRDTGKVPSSVTVTLLRSNDGSNEADTAISTSSATPDANGAFSVRVAFKDLPVGYYRLGLSTGRTGLGELWLEVATIVKPAFGLDVTTDRHAVLSGAKVMASVAAAFFEGTPVAGMELSLSSDSVTGETKATTDADGHASGPVALRLDPDGDQWGVTAVQAIPTLPEEAEISAMSDVAVFRATAVVDTSAVLAGTRLGITGKVSNVVFERFETAAPTALWDVDPRGAGRPDAAVVVKVVQHTPIRRQTGTRYDFITKQVVPVYDYTDREEVVSSQAVRTGADGTFRMSLTVKGGDRSYDVRATYTDEGRRQTTATAWAQGPELHEDRNAWLESADPAPASDGGPDEYSVGEEVRVRFMGGLDKAPVSRYFYAVAQRGLTYATVGTSPTFRTTFTAASVPSIRITGVRFNGYGYDLAVSSFRAQIRFSDRALTVKVTPDKARYRPGEAATVTIGTLDPDGKPVAASVYVQVVDEKLYAIGAAGQVDPLGELYRDVGDGIIVWAASHRTPGDDGGGGDTTGGGCCGDRSDFRDWLVARMVTTGSDGTASIAVPLSDDLTSWHVSAAAVDAALHAGSGTGFLAVGLPFFAEATIAPEYLVVDRPVIRVRGFGSGLATGETVTFTVSSDTLLMSGVTATADAFKAAEVPLPALKQGTHRIRITATVGSGSTLRSDTLTRTFDVVTTRTTRLETTWSVLDGPMDVKAGSDLTRVTLVDAGRGRVVPILQELAWTDGGRSDRVLAAGLANRVLVEQFGLEAPAETGELDLQRFQWDGSALAIVAYGSGNLDVTALAAMANDPRLDASSLAGWLEGARGDSEYRRDDRLLALAGLAGLGEPVLPGVREAAAQTDLTIPEQVNVALAALYAGDEALARSIERDLLSNHALRLGPWVRVDPGAGADASLQTARLAIVAASLGDPVAADMDAWVAANPPMTTTVALERALAAQGWAKRVAGAPAVAAITVDGTRQELTIKPDQPASIVLTPAQAATARLEPVSGSVLVVTSWVGPLDPASLTPPKGQVLERTVRPAGVIGPTDTVIVTFRVTLGPTARDECWRVTDLAPSGLAPIIGGGSWVWDEDGNYLWAGTSPDFVDGQRVEFCVTRDPKQPVQTLRYVARVVTPGTYLWEGAVLQSTVVPEQGLVLDPVSVTIKGTGS